MLRSEAVIDREDHGARARGEETADRVVGLEVAEHPAAAVEEDDQRHRGRSRAASERRAAPRSGHPSPGWSGLRPAAVGTFGPPTTIDSFRALSLASATVRVPPLETESTPTRRASQSTTWMSGAGSSPPTSIAGRTVVAAAGAAASRGTGRSGCSTRGEMRGSSTAPAGYGMGHSELRQMEAATTTAPWRRPGAATRGLPPGPPLPAQLQTAIWSRQARRVCLPAASATAASSPSGSSTKGPG